VVFYVFVFPEFVYDLWITITTRPIHPLVHHPDHPVICPCLHHLNHPLFCPCHHIKKVTFAKASLAFLYHATASSPKRAQPKVFSSDYSSDISSTIRINYSVGEEKTKNINAKHTAAGIPTWSPTVVLICRSTAYVWQSGRDAQFSADCGRMCLYGIFYRIWYSSCTMLFDRSLRQGLTGRINSDSTYDFRFTLNISIALECTARHSTL
jgi:hypothetical protein